MLNIKMTYFLDNAGLDYFPTWYNQVLQACQEQAGFIHLSYLYQNQNPVVLLCFENEAKFNFWQNHAKNTELVEEIKQYFVLPLAVEKITRAYTVTVILEAKLGKAAELKAELESVAIKSRAEKTCLEYRLHQTIDNPHLFILYEQWVSQEKHQAQFTKPYIIELAKKMDDLLARPYQIFLAEEI